MSASMPDPLSRIEYERSLKREHELALDMAYSQDRLDDEKSLRAMNGGHVFMGTICEVARKAFPHIESRLASIRYCADTVDSATGSINAPPRETLDEPDLLELMGYSSTQEFLDAHWGCTMHDLLLNYSEIQQTVRGLAGRMGLHVSFVEVHVSHIDDMRYIQYCSEASIVVCLMEHMGM